MTEAERVIESALARSRDPQRHKLRYAQAPVLGWQSRDKEDGLRERHEAKLRAAGLKISVDDTERKG